MDGAELDITALLAAARLGDRQASERVFPIVYKELRRLAALHMGREATGHSLQPTALVHEAYIRLIQSKQDWRDRTHFFAIASRIMRNVLVDEARTRLAVKRGAGGGRVTLDDLQIAAPNRHADILAIDQALNRLSELNERQAKVVEMTFFGGLKEEETAVTLGISVRTVHRDWVTARAWLHAQLSA
jgi:RNA polymerase sigma factor (TIGR02999 family)